METGNRKLCIRPMADGDEDAVVALWQSAGLTRPWNDPWRDLDFARGKAGSDILTGWLGRELVAVAMVGQDGHRGAVYYLGIAPERQGCGYGRAMMGAVEQWLIAHGVWKLNLMVRSDNAEVKAFYRKLGYVTEATEVMSRRLE